MEWDARERQKHTNDQRQRLKILVSNRIGKAIGIFKPFFISAFRVRKVFFIYLFFFLVEKFQQFLLRFVVVFFFLYVLIFHLHFLSGIFIAHGFSLIEIIWKIFEIWKIRCNFQASAINPCELNPIINLFFFTFSSLFLFFFVDFLHFFFDISSLRRETHLALGKHKCQMP